MIAAPYYMLAVGIMLLIAGAFIAASGGSSRGPYIDPRMSDREIKKALRKQETGGSAGIAASLVGGLGILLIIVSIVWRVLGIGYE
jgi:hypothetical protein